VNWGKSILLLHRGGIGQVRPRDARRLGDLQGVGGVGVLLDLGLCGSGGLLAALHGRVGRACRAGRHGALLEELPDRPGVAGDPLERRLPGGLLRACLVLRRQHHACRSDARRRRLEEVPSSYALLIVACAQERSP
jgi:hypothetical protein